MPTDIESYKIKYDGGVAAPTNYAPFKMKAAGKYNNSPILKNYGTPAQRGIAAFGTKDSEGVDKISTDSDFSPFAAVGGSPNKGIFDRIKKGISKGVKRIGKAMGLGPKVEDATAAAQAGATVAPHGDEAHTGDTAAATVGGGFQGGDPNALMAKQVGFMGDAGGVGGGAQVADASGFGTGGAMGTMKAAEEEEGVVQPTRVMGV